MNPGLGHGSGVVLLLVLVLCLGSGTAGRGAAREERFEGEYFSGEGNTGHLRLLDIARRMFGSDPEFQHVAMLYTPQWNGWVEGPTWGAWWVQNSYGTTYCALPFYEEPFVQFLQNSQDLWFNRMGDGRTSHEWNGRDRWVPPDGCLMDAASDTWAIHKQGDGRVAIHDWGMEFTAAGALLQAELLLIGRDPAALARYLPKLERCAAFLESRRDPANNLFLAGPAANLLAPSYAGVRRPDGTYGMAYLTGLSVTTIALLDRMIELESLAGRTEMAGILAGRRNAARTGLQRLTLGDGTLVKSMDPDGTLHGVYGAERHGYFEASPNHDAVCFRVVDDAQARRIYDRIASIPGLRPHDLIVANCPSLDDMYEEPRGLWAFGTWVNGGHWTTCEARMMMAYHRVGAFADARRSMEQMLRFARRFRLDNPLVEFGGAVYQPREPVNLTYDAFGAPAGLLRGLFEYLYRADGLTLVPHIPDGVERLEQKFPIRFGRKRLFLAVSGRGPITSVRVNGRRWRTFDSASVFLPYEATPDLAAVEIIAGDGRRRGWRVPREKTGLPEVPAPGRWPEPPIQAAIAATELPLRIGADSDGGSRFTGDLARVAVFDRALDDAEIARLSRPERDALLDDPAVVGCWSAVAAGSERVRSPAGRAPEARIVGQVGVVASEVGPAFRFVGKGYLEVSNAPALALPRGGTWYAWVRPGRTPGRLIDKCPVGGSTGYLLDLHPGNALRLITDSGTLASGTPLAADRWVHVAATVEATGRSTLYVDGRVVARQDGARPGADLAGLTARVGRVRRFHQSLVRAGWGDSYEAAHAAWVVRCLATAHARAEGVAAGRWAPLPDRTRVAADRLYLATVSKLYDGLVKVLEAPDGNGNGSGDPRAAAIRACWRATPVADP